MPRLIRDTTHSERVNTLSAQAEVLFYRLLMKADDYGLFHAKPTLIKANCYPLRLDSVRETDISRWIAECEKAGLLAIYEADSKPFLVIRNFGQKLKNMRQVYPPPPESLIKNFGLPEENRREENSETELEGERRAREEILNFFRKEFRQYRPNEDAKLQRDYEQGIKKENLVARRDNIINGVVEQFWNHYEKQGWKTSGGALITNKLAAFKGWMAKEKEFAK